MLSGPEHTVLQPSGDWLRGNLPFSGARGTVLSTRLSWEAEEQRLREGGNLFVNFALCYGKLLGFKKL